MATTQTVTTYKLQARSSDEVDWRTVRPTLRQSMNLEDCREWADAYKRDGYQVRIVKQVTVMTTTVEVVE